MWRLLNRGIGVWLMISMVRRRSCNVRDAIAPESPPARPVTAMGGPTIQWHQDVLLRTLPVGWRQKVRYIVWESSSCHHVEWRPRTAWKLGFLPRRFRCHPWVGRVGCAVRQKPASFRSGTAKRASSPRCMATVRAKAIADCEISSPVTSKPRCDSMQLRAPVPQPNSRILELGCAAGEVASQCATCSRSAGAS